MEVISFPTISSDGTLKKEYLDSYNRDLTKDDIDSMIMLCKNKQIQKLINEYNVRKIYVSDWSYRGIEELFVQSCINGNVDFVKFIYEKLSYDHKAKSLIEIKKSRLNLDSKVSDFIGKHISEFMESGDYSEGFNAV